ncbi:nickel pincer cofactor biosynthesis protein LarB [Halalkalibacter oceani]|uniref:Nickel pincer cofactor biosynthesis protein LarB n=1 Tax=Halalkalibacter oceani TaxID=1653776 RepID=A0A9X2DP33_9BACI|nr:nickel pincer cofactor biosynthesis protein LarB [Halalkalibacter oceani]MCM3714506.1 nickel pincer cofactor biosynthesis protein LarB [Halalkalibacter oceani]
MSNEIKEWLKKVEAGELRAEEAYEQIKGYEDIDGFAKIDVQRVKRKGFPEVIYGEGKTAEQIQAIFSRLMTHHETVLATRISKEKAEQLVPQLVHVTYDECSRTLLYDERKSFRSYGKVGVLCAGTSDLPVAEEAAITAQAMGLEIARFYDIGVAGIHRLFDQLEQIRTCDVLIVVAGMEGALVSVVGGLVQQPILAVPTSIGYGASFHGVAALLTMLNSCASGVSVVNIDNGFGAAYQAALISRIKKE